MKKLLWSSVAALLVLAAGAARADCGTCETKAEKPAGAKMTCPCMCLQGVTLTDAQKAKVDTLQAKCKEDCTKGCTKACNKACRAELKKILTKEQFAQVSKACKVGKKCPAGAAKKEEVKKEEPKKEEAK